MKSLALLALSALMLVSATAAQAAYPGANGRIAYESNQGGADKEIMSGAPDGSGSTQLTSNTVTDIDPAWSPDGKKIAFARFGAGSNAFDLWTMNADGSGQTVLIEGGGTNLTHPTWKPDGTRIAFEAEISPANHDIYGIDTTGANLSGIATNAADEREPAWSPVDANKILFSLSSGGDFGLRTVNPSTLALTVVLDQAGHDLTSPAWSPDGANIGYTYELTATDDQLRIANANGTSQSGVAVTAANERHIAFSPENNLFVYDLSGADTEIAARNLPAGGQHIMEVRAATNDENPDWQPITTAQVRPKGATPLSMPLTIAFKPCTSPNSTHDAPFAFGSCVPPRPSSPNLTVAGEPLVNGKVANFIGSLKLKTLAPSDAQLTAVMTDVRCARAVGACTGGPLSDYVGAWSIQLIVQMTDRSNAGAAGTTQAAVLTLNAPSCQSTADTTIGSTCAATGSLNAAIPGVIVPGRRATWELPQGSSGVTVRDATGTPFAVGGTFYP